MCKIVTKLKLFVSQSRCDTADVLQGVVVYIHLTGLLFVFSWFGDELSTQVNRIDNFNFSFIIIDLDTAIQVIHFSLIPVWTPKIILMLLFTSFDVHFSSFLCSQIPYFTYQTRLQTVYFEGDECTADCLYYCYFTKPSVFNCVHVAILLSSKKPFPLLHYLSISGSDSEFNSLGM